MIDQTRSTSKSPTASKDLNRRTANLPPSASRQSTPRDKKPGSDEAKPGAGKKKRLICYRCGGKGHPARLCPSADDCQDVDEVGTEPSSDADSELFGLDWGDDPIATINSVTERNEKFVVEKNCWHSLIPVRLTMCFPSQCVPSISSNNDFQVEERSGFQRRKRVTHQTLRTATLSSQDKRWKQYEHHLGSRGFAQAADLCPSSA